MKNIANADRPKSVGAMLPPRPFRGSGKVAQTACNSDRREGKSCIPTLNQTFADSRILKISKFPTFRIAAGWARPFSVCGLVGLDLSCNADQVERTFQDTRLDGREHYYALIQVAGHVTMSQNDQTRQLAVGDVAIVDSARPVIYFPHTGGAQWLTLQLPRRSLASHLGFEPLGGIRGCDGTAAGRLLHRIVLDALGGDGLSSPRADSYM